MKAKGKSTQYWSNFLFFLLLGGNYSRAVANDILAESCWLMELAFSERRPKDVAVGTGTRGRGWGWRRARGDKCFCAHTNSTTESEYVYVNL